ncbi:hypothetical protein QTG54_002041 [Skeletonema marinoi]|uniref:Myb-like domain-containing protein n=1 Tax=Skeletonema marinoi TaxID=267567 RepID=A0AAD9DGU6_9STRA|nr:hypothetical protein QTG54_002041 [Skeletonema marinoi]
MPSWDTTRTTASGPGTISGWSVCSNLASGTGAAVGKDGGAAAAGGAGGTGKEGSDALLNSAASPGDGDSLYRAGVENFGRANGASSTFSLPSATAAMGGAGGGGEDDISPKSILSKDGKNKKSMPQGTHVQFSRGGGEEGSIPGAKRMAPHLSRSPYDDYYDYPPTRYHHAPPPPSHHHSYYDSPSHHHDAYYADPHYHHPYPPPSHHSRGGGGGGGGGYNARHHYHHGPPPPSSGGGHYYDRHSHDFPPSPSPTHHHRQDELPTGHLRCANFPNPHGWTKEEDTALITIMKGTKKNPQSWSPIGHQLGRSPTIVVSDGPAS